MLLADKMLKEGFTPFPSWTNAITPEDFADFGVKLLDRLALALKFKIDNVADYFFHNDNEYDNGVSDDFPNVAPSSPVMWMEYSAPAQIFSRGEWISGHQRMSRGYGFLFEHKHNDDGGWSACVYPFIHLRDGSIVGPIDCLMYDIEPNGSFRDSYKVMAIGERGEELDRFVLRAEIAVKVTWLAMSFLHCKNVLVNDHDGLYANRQERREAQRRNEEPRSTFHTLQIEPMKKVLATEGGIATNGLKKALHICRGHFSEYGDEYGKGKLFGKYEGRFFVPAHVRGSSDMGEVKKDYNVKAPRKDAA